MARTGLRAACVGLAALGLAVAGLVDWSGLA
jgi:hypothetical protein